MNRGNNTFWDFCKAENTDDEDDNSDLQSQLYAQIYYAPNGQENLDTQSTIKSDTTNVDGTQSLENMAKKHTKKSETMNAFGSPVKTSNFDEHDTKSHLNSSQFVEEDDKSNVTLVCPAFSDQVPTTEDENKDNLNLPNVEMLNEHCFKDNRSAKPSEESMKSLTVTDNEIIPDVKSETELEEKVEIKSTECLIPVTMNEVSSNNKRNNIENKETKAKKIKESDAEEDCRNSNILNKYSFSKTFINNLYLKKYESLEKTLEIEEEEEQIPEASTVVPLDDSKNDTRYNVVRKDKKDTTAKSSDEETIVIPDSDSDSDSDSHSEDSILEVPIPPKPKPPIIKLLDSDESSESSDSDDDLVAIVDSEVQSTKDTRSEDKELPCLNEKETNTSVHFTKNSTHTVTVQNEEDIVLNCTEVQKAASSLKEIRQMSKSMQSEQCQKSDKNIEKNKSSPSNRENDKRSNKLDQAVDKVVLAHKTHTDDNLSNDNDKNLNTTSILTKASYKNKAAYERDKNDSNIDFTKDVELTNMWDTDELNVSRKRRHENKNEHEPGTSAKQRKCSINENVQPGTSTKQTEQTSKSHKTKEESWEDYFFRPMSETLKAFYTDSRGQENYDINEIQSKMSKNPRLWAILDEDLMPNYARKQRFWNVKCNHCHQEGHQRYNCPEPRKLPQCHMCGIQGHTESRCPQKMCLTCGKKQGTFRKTCESCRVLYCNMCKAIGHKSTECPDLWRRFHQTTRSTEINIPENLNEVMKPADLLYCCNCTKRGHDSSTCREYRWSQHFPTPTFVSSYTGNPTYSDYIMPTPKEGDVIPLSSKKSETGTKNATRTRQDNDLSNCKIVFTCGSFRAGPPKRQEIKQEILHRKDFQLTSLIAGRASPRFLRNLTKTVPFEVIIYFDTENKLMVRVRSYQKITTRIYDLLEFWFKLPENEKNQVVDVDLPTTREELYVVVFEKWQQLLKNKEDPAQIQKQIKRLKSAMANTTDSAEQKSISERLLNFQRTLVGLYHTQPKYSPSATMLAKALKLIRKKGNFTIQFLRIVTQYIKIFTPYTLPEKEITAFSSKYYTVQQPKNPANNKKKNKNKSLDAYSKFLLSLKVANDKQRAALGTTEVINTTNEPENSSNVNLQKKKKKKQKKQNNDAVTNNPPSPVKGKIHSKQTIEHTQNVMCPIEATQVSGNQEIPKTSSATETNSENLNLPSTSSNFDPIPHETGMFVNSLLKQGNIKEPICNNVAPTTTEYIQNTEKELEKTRNVNEKVSTSTSKVFDDTIDKETEQPTKKRKKSKKSKKAEQNHESTVQPNENQAIVQTNEHPVSVDRAKQVIKEALSFSQPYMVTSALEVQKRINDNSLKAEHIDILQHMVDLEKVHQSKISSFYSSLK